VTSCSRYDISREASFSARSTAADELASGGSTSSVAKREEEGLGDPFTENSANVTKATTVIFLLSNLSVGSMSCMDQLHLAYELDKPMLICVTDYDGKGQLMPSARMMLFRKPMVHFINVSPTQKRMSELRLINALSTLLMIASEKEATEHMAQEVAVSVLPDENGQEQEQQSGQPKRKSLDSMVNSMATMPVRWLSGKTSSSRSKAVPKDSSSRSKAVPRGSLTSKISSWRNRAPNSNKAAQPKIVPSEDLKEGRGNEK
jgi:hypothetical protein